MQNSSEIVCRGVFQYKTLLVVCSARETHSIKLSDGVNWLVSLQTICDDTKLNFTHLCVSVCGYVCLYSGLLDCTQPQPSALADRHHCVNMK